jgi:hypothetical protein
MMSSLVLASMLLTGAWAAPYAPAPTALPTLGPVPIAVICLDALEAPRRVDDELRTIYEGGRSYHDFLAGATRRTELWHGNTEKSADIDASLVERAKAIGGTWRFLAVAVDSCSDSVSTIPYLAQLVALVDGLDMRVVDSTVGREIMESHRTPDGRPATPTVLLLDDAWEEAGCFIERPPALQTWILEEGFSSDDVFPNKMAWYAEDSGRSTVEAFVEMLETAARGDATCR